MAPNFSRQIYSTLFTKTLIQKVICMLTLILNFKITSQTLYSKLLYINSLIILNIQKP